MRNLLESFLDKEIDLNCGTVLFSGIVRKVQGEILELEKDGVSIFIRIEKIIALSEVREKKTATPPGFVNKI